MFILNYDDICVYCKFMLIFFYRLVVVFVEIEIQWVDWKKQCDVYDYVMRVMGFVDFIIVVMSGEVVEEDVGIDVLEFFDVVELYGMVVLVR